MADPFGIVGVLSLAFQITQIMTQFGQDWKNAPNDAKSFLAELQTLKTVLSETHTNLLLNKDYADAFQCRPSVLLSRLGPQALSSNETKSMLSACEKDLGSLLDDLKKRAKGHRGGWERLKGAFLAKGTRESVENLHRQCQTLNSLVMIDAAVLGSAIYKEVKDVRKAQEEERKEQKQWHQAVADNEILTWLTPVDDATQHSDVASRRQEGTGEWLLNAHEFDIWMNQSNQILFCPGIPGAGKTISTSTVVDKLYATFQDDVSVGLAYTYFNFRRQHEQRAIDNLSSLLKQLLQRRSCMPQSIQKLREAHLEKGTRPSLTEISAVLQSMVADYSQTFIIVDALDECRASDGERKRVLAELFKIQARGSVNLMVTSRFVPEIEKEFESRAIWLEIRASDDDLQRYIDGNLDKLPSFVLRRPDLQQEIKATIIKAVAGMFLLAQLHLNSLIGKRSPKAIRTALEQLPKGSGAYDDAYQEAMERIESQGPDSEELAKQVLSWITCAKRPLIVTELQHALATEVGALELDEENLPDIDDMVSVCAGLVTVDGESHIIRLVHYTTQEYFERTWGAWFPDAHTEIAKICTTYLSFDDFGTGFCPNDEAFEQRLRSHPLYVYAARNWGHHLRDASADVNGPIPAFLRNEGKRAACSQVLMAPMFRDVGYSQRMAKDVTALHLAAGFGLTQVTFSLVQEGYDPDCKDTDIRTPLSWAVENGHDATIKMLLAPNNINPDSEDKEGRSPLLWAVLANHESSALLLLADDRIDPNCKDKGGQSPLASAVAAENESMTRLLLAHDRIDPNSQDNYGRSPLSLAAYNNRNVLVELLVASERVDLNTKDREYGRTPLSWAALLGSETIATLLLSKTGVDPNSKDKYGLVPLSLAVLSRHEAIVKLLLNTDGVDLESEDGGGLTPMSWAMWSCQPAVVDLLLARHDIALKYGPAAVWWKQSLDEFQSRKLLCDSAIATAPPLPKELSWMYSLLGVSLSRGRDAEAIQSQWDADVGTMLSLWDPNAERMQSLWDGNAEIMQSLWAIAMGYQLTADGIIYNMGRV